MRTLLRALCLSAVFALSAGGISACQRQGASTSEEAGGPTDADREAALAAEQLAALGGAASPEQRALYEGEFQASGGLDSGASGDTAAGEGAWELRLLNDYAQFTRPGLGEDGGVTGERDYHERGMRVVAGAVTITIMAQTCSASGIELPYTANVIYEGVSYQGCARRGIEEGERPTWASVLPELMPAINACLSRATSRPARVTFATVLNESEYSVRVREANGARHECITTDGQISVYETLSDVDRRPGEGDPEFVMGQQPAAAQCRSVEPAVSRNGEQMGWLVRRSC